MKKLLQAVKEIAKGFLTTFAVVLGIGVLVRYIAVLTKSLWELLKIAIDE